MKWSYIWCFDRGVNKLTSEWHTDSGNLTRILRGGSGWHYTVDATVYTYDRSGYQVRCFVFSRDMPHLSFTLLCGLPLFVYFFIRSVDCFWQPTWIRTVVCHGAQVLRQWVILYIVSAGLYCVFWFNHGHCLVGETWPVVYKMYNLVLFATLMSHLWFTQRHLIIDWGNCYRVE